MKEELRGKMIDPEFKKEALGALEFKYKIVNDDFEEVEVDFRIERVSLQTYSKIGEGKTGDIILGNVLKNFISQPLEARKTDYFKMCTGALQEISDICKEFQESPLSFSFTD